jgi:hypothetical protein
MSHSLLLAQRISGSSICLVKTIITKTGRRKQWNSHVTLFFATRTALPCNYRVFWDYFSYLPHHSGFWNRLFGIWGSHSGGPSTLGRRVVCHRIYTARWNFHWQNSGIVCTIKCFLEYIEHKTRSDSSYTSYSVRSHESVIWLSTQNARAPEALIILTTSQTRAFYTSAAYTQRN